MVDAASREVDARVTVDRPGRPRAGGLRGLRSRARAPREPRKQAGGARRARRRGQPGRTPQRHGGGGAPLRGGAGAPGRADRRGGARSLAGSRRSRTRAASCGGRRLSRFSSPVLATGLLSLLLSASLGRSLQEIMEAARQYAKGNLTARIRVRRDDELGELARIINHSADQLQGRHGGDRAGSRADRRDPLGDGRRRPRGGPPRHRRRSPTPACASALELRDAARAPLPRGRSASARSAR